MEFWAIILKIITLILIVLWQVIFFVFKLVPVWLFLTLIEKLMIWWNQITQLIVESWLCWFCILSAFIIFSWYLIIVWLLHLIVNVNVFKNAIDEDVNNKWRESKKYNLTFSIVNTFRRNFLSAISALKWNNWWENVLSRLELIKDNILVKILFFQWWLWWHRHIKSIFENVTRKSIWFNMIFIVAIIWLVWYWTTYEKEYVWQDWEHIVIWNWYDYISNQLTRWVAWWTAFINWMTSSIDDSITYRDRRIQTIAKLYYKTSLLWPIWWIDMIEYEEDVVNIWNTSWNDNLINEITNDTQKNNANIIASLREDKDSKDWSSWIYLNEFMNSVYWTKIPKYAWANYIKSCIGSISENSKIRDKYFIDESLYNSKIFSDYVKNPSTKIEWTKISSEDHINLQKYIKNWKNWNYKVISISQINSLVEKYWFSIPWQWKNVRSDSIWLYFILWKEWEEYYIVDENAVKVFEKEFNTNTIKIWKRYFNAKMILENNARVTDFCYWYALLAPYKQNWTLNTKEWTYWNIKYTEYDYKSLLEKNMISVWATVKAWANSQWVQMSDNALLQASWYLLTNTTFYLNDTLSNDNLNKDFESLSKYFYMFSRWDEEQHFEYLIWWSINWLYNDFNSLINSLEFETIDDKKKIEEIMKDKDIQDIVWRYIWINKTIWEYQSQLIASIKKQYDVIPSSKIFNERSVETLETLYFNWYKQEVLKHSAWSDIISRKWILSYWSISNLITWISKEVNVNEIQTFWSEDWTKQKVMFFWKESSINDELWWQKSYQKVWVLLWIFPLVESSIWFMNFILFILYIWLYLLLVFLWIWFSWIWQFFKNYAEYKENKEEANFDYLEESIDLLCRLWIFICLLKLYFVFSIF